MSRQKRENALERYASDLRKDVDALLRGEEPNDLGSEQCGSCRSFDGCEFYCPVEDRNTSPTDPACISYQPVDEEE